MAPDVSLCRPGFSPRATCAAMTPLKVLDAATRSRLNGELERLITPIDPVTFERRRFIDRGSINPSRTPPSRPGVNFS
jgi:hypothetical protein